MVDLLKAKIGDIAHFKCGGSAKIIKVAPTMMAFNLTSVDSIEWWSHEFLSQVSSPFEITRIEVPPFDWTTVKPGMAFHSDGELYIFIGNQMLISNGNDLCGIFQSTSCTSNIRNIHRNHVIRAPEHDICK